MSQNKSPICFISAVASNLWGGSEELWSQTALYLARKGVPVAVSIAQWSSPHPVLQQLLGAGAKVQQRPMKHKLVKRVRRNIGRQKNTSWLTIEVDDFLRRQRPSLVVLSDGIVLPPLELMELCIENRWPFAVVGHQCPYDWWPEDKQAERLRIALPVARRCYFICKSHRSLVEGRLSYQLSNAEIAYNPFNVAFDAAPPWPALGQHDELRLACVGRLEAGHKGQDILFEVLSRPTWLARPWLLTLYGSGPNKDGLARLCARLGLGNRVAFAGHANSVETLWSENHALIMPSRHEGQPLVIVEAMLCGRPVVATNVGGIKEIVEDGVTGILADVPTVDSVQNALERLWAKRTELEGIGRAAAKSIRNIVPPNPAEAFSNSLLQLL